jgi:hypothetical protein
MKLLPTLLLCLAPVVASASAAEPSKPALEISFGTTKYLPLRVPRTKAADYVADAPGSVIAAIHACGGSNTSYRQHTDGAASVVFTAIRPADEVRACLHKILPQATIETRLRP